jgi:hypothetical protein
MNITAEKLQFASMIDARQSRSKDPASIDFTIFAEMAAYLPNPGKTNSPFFLNLLHSQNKIFSRRKMPRPKTNEIVGSRGPGV